MMSEKRLSTVLHAGRALGFLDEKSAHYPLVRDALDRLTDVEAAPGDTEETNALAYQHANALHSALKKALINSSDDESQRLTGIVANSMHLMRLHAPFEGDVGIFTNSHKKMLSDPRPIATGNTGAFFRDQDLVA